MLFNSFAFIKFLPIVFLLYWFVFKPLRWQNALLLIASYYFYSRWSYLFLGLLMLSTLLDYLYGFGVASPNRRKAKIFLWLSVLTNLGILAVFKYYNFFATEFQQVVEACGMHIEPVLLQVILPVGISFYTFHGMSYVFDIYRGERKPVRNVVEYSVFVSFFPLLVAGPIERANHLLPQLQVQRRFRYEQAVEGCRLILWGLVKKVLIADQLAGIVNGVFDDYQHQSGLGLLMGAIAFSFQVYGDFSGYSDIAIGTAKLFGIELLSNFRFPYFSRNLAEFWRRWHISLTSWFRDYLYLPIGGSSQGMVKTVRNIFVIFIISGFWHGAGWNYIGWGFIHACGFLPLLLLKRNRRYQTIVAVDRWYPTPWETLQMVGTFLFHTLALIVFRSENLPAAWGYLKRMVVTLFNDHQPVDTLWIFAYIVPLVLADWWFRRDERHLRMPGNRLLRHTLYFVLILLVLLNLQKPAEFIYFQF